MKNNHEIFLAMNTRDYDGKGADGCQNPELQFKKESTDVHNYKPDKGYSPTLNAKGYPDTSC